MKIFYCILTFLFTLYTFAQCLPVLDLPFNGNSQDISGNNNHAIASGTPALTADRFGNPNSAYEFGGVGDVDFFTVTNNPTLHFTNQLSISYWFKQCSFMGMDGWGNLSPTGQHVIMAKLGDGMAAQPGFWFGQNVNTNNQLNWYFANKNGYGNTINFQVGASFNCINLCEWVHVVVVVNSTNLKAYFNGQLVQNQTINSADFTVANTKPLLIGKMDGTWYPYRGTIDDIKIYNCAIDDATVTTLFGGFSDPNNANVTPTFDNIASICAGSSLSPLPTTSNNGITGTWSPAINNAATTTYIFTPTAGQCANATSMTIEVISPPTVPTFTPTGPFNNGESFTLPTTSLNGINGSWSPAVNNSETTTYTFTPASGQCATTTTMTVEIANTTPCDTSGWTSEFRYLSQVPHIVPFTQALNTDTGTISLPPSLANGNYYWSVFTYEPPQSVCVPDNFSIEFKLHSNIPSGISAFDTTITIDATGGTSWVTLMGAAWGQPWTSLGVNGQTLLSNASSLIFPNLLDWSIIRLEFINGQLKYYVNNNLFYTGAYTGNVCNLNWFKVEFKGSGSIDYVKVYDENNTTIYLEEFTSCNPMSTFPDLCNQTVNLTTSVTEPDCDNENIQLNANVQPTNNSLSYLWTGPNGFSSNDQNPIITNPTSNNIGTYTCVVQSNPCHPLASSDVVVSNIDVLPNVTPTFTQVAAICSGATLSALPTTSNNGITGTWSPALNNTATTTYTFTPSAGQCATTATMTITVNLNVTPTFTQVAAICSGATLSALPTTSNNGITGTWSPALNNTATTTYTFTPSAGQCATTATMTITVNPNVTPTFTQVAAICSGATLSALPTTSNNGITGTWSPALNNTATTTYTFTPSAGQCASTVQLTVVVNPQVVPTFNSIPPICQGGSITLPTQSTNGISGTWSPAVNNQSTTTYTFTPTTEQCSSTVQLTVVVNPQVVPTFNSIPSICQGGSITLPTQSTNGISGTWSPAVNNQTTTVYTFTPTTGQCASTVQLTVVVNPQVVPTFNSIPSICQGGSITLPTQSTNGISGTWSPAVNNQATTTYIFTPTTGQCASTVQLTVVVNDKPIVNLEDKILCFNMDSQSYNPVLIDSGLPQQFFHFQWFFTPPNGTIQSINSNGNSIWVDLEGTYSLLVTNSATNCSSDLVSFQASTYNMPQDITVGVFNHFSDNAHISIQVLGNDESLQYQLNNDPPQGFPFFTNLSNGLYLVKVFNENNCFYFEKQVVVLNYMKFFTPNNDGYNDNWLFKDPFNYINKVTIFDRYGKLIKELNMNEVNIGWDGQYNGRNLPSSDYWFVVDYTIENINYIFSKHFSLKR